MTGEGIKTKAMGDVGEKLRDLGWNPAHLTAECNICDVHNLACIFQKPESIMTIREGAIAYTNERKFKLTWINAHIHSS